MNGARWVSCCAVVGALMIAVSARAPAQQPDGEESVLVENQAGEVKADHPDFCQCVGETNSRAVARIDQALRNPLRSDGLEFKDSPLEEVVRFLQDEYGIPIQLDTPALDEIGLGPDEPVTVSFHDISLRSALRLMFKTLQITYVINNEVLIITTPEEAETQLVTCVYDIQGLTETANEKSVKALIDTIVSCVVTETWAANGGGEAEIRLLKPGLLVISQTQAVHDEIGGLLAAIREMQGRRPVPAEAAVFPAAHDAEKVVTRAYTLQLNPSDDIDTIRNQVRELIVQSLPDAKWKGRLDDGQSVALAVFHDRVVVRHRQSVQDEVQALLVDSGVAAPATPSAAGEMGPGGYGGEFGRAEGGGRSFFQPNSATSE